nr:hypothetical protein [Tanacetum cinerariifolium]
MALAIMAKAFKLNYSTPTNNNQRISLNPRNRNLNGYNDVQNVKNQVIQHAAQNPRIQNVRNPNGLIGVPENANPNPNRNGVGHFVRNCTVRPKRRDAAYLQTQLLIAQKEEARIQLQAGEFDLMAAAADLDEIEEVNANYILMAKLQQASTSGTQTDKGPTKDLHTADYTQLYDFLKYNQKEVDDLKAEQLARTQDPLALMASSKNPYAFLEIHQDQPSFNQNYMQQPIPNPEDITDPTTVMNMALAIMAKAFKLNYSTPTNNNQRISLNPRNR